MKDEINKAEFLKCLQTIKSPFVPQFIEVFEVTDSTNTQGRLFLNNPENTPKANLALFLANQQTNGRGRQGKSFYSPKGTGLYATIIFDTEKIPFKTELYTPAAAVAVTRAIKKYLNLDSKIKWVNDIFIENKKICGILSEGIISKGKISHVILGIGINISTIFTEESQLSSIASSLESYTKVPIEINMLGAYIFSELYNCLFENEEIIMKEYKDKSLLINKEIQVLDQKEPYFATVKDITKEGHLLILPKTSEKTKILISGEISIKI